MKRFMRWIAAPFLFALAMPMLAAQALPEALKDADPQKLMAVGFGLMQMDEDEKTRFGTTIQEFNKQAADMIKTEMWRNRPNKGRTIRRKLADMFEDLDERVKPIVTEGREPGWRIFKKGLADQMKPG